MSEVVPATAIAPAPLRFPCLDAYRAIGMTMVLLNHAAYSTGFIQRSQGPEASGLEAFVGAVVARFDMSVPMFFVMSGFLLYRPFAKATLAERELPATAAFFERRALRIFPAYWVALAGLGLLSALSSTFDLGITSIGSWIGNALALPAFGVPVEVCKNGSCHVGYGITQAWSIGVEITFYLVLPLIAAGLARLVRRAGSSSTATLLAGTAVLWATGTAFRAAVVIVDPSWARQSLLWLPMFLDLFALGMALAVISARWGVAGPAGPVRTLAAHPALCWAIAGAVLVIMTRFQPPDEPFGLNGSEYLPRQFIYGLAAVLWLLPAMFGDQTAGRLRRGLAARPLTYLGAISLSFYLWHLAMISFAKAWTVPDYALRVAAEQQAPPGSLAGVATFTGNFPLVATIAWVVSMAIAAVAFKFVEVPGQHLKARLRRG